MLKIDKTIIISSPRVHGPIWMKFGFQIEFDLRKTVTPTSTKPEVVLSRRGHQLEIVHDVINYSTAGGPIWTKCGSLVRNSTPIIIMIWSKYQPLEKSNMADFCFPKPEVVISQP